VSFESIGTAPQGSPAPHRIVVVLGAAPDIDLGKIAGRAFSESRALVLLPLGRPLSPRQRTLISDVAHLCWSWFDALRCSTAGTVDAIAPGDEVIVAASEQERRRFEAMRASTPGLGRVAES